VAFVELGLELGRSFNYAEPAAYLL